jgi:3-deoxy-D-manno-octulosonic-acid transferase
LIIFYHLFLFFYKAGIYFISFWNPKAKLWIDGRRKVFKKLKEKLQTKGNGKRIWVHCASLGEFEQVRPVLIKIREVHPTATFVVSFFSPSGYEIIKNKQDFPNVFYLPMDSRIHAKKWMDIVKPDLILWVKYEYWHFYLQEIKKRHIPLLMISSVYRSNQVFFKWYGGFYRNILGCFTHFFVQNEDSKEQLQKIISPEKITVSGDTRCDRVINIVEGFTEVTGIKEFCGESKVIVMGSTWEEDEAEWTHFVRQHPEMRFIIAPHEIDSENLAHVQKGFPDSVLYSEWTKRIINNRPPTTDTTIQTADISHQTSDIQRNCLIIDNIGTLSRLYHYATITYVGGGFGDDGLHNILEAAVYGKPVIFGPEYEKNFEAEEMIECKGAISINHALELEKILNELLNNEEELLMRSNAAKNYVYKNAGATDKIISFLKETNLL